MNSAQVRIQYADGRVEERWLPVGTFVVGREAGDIVLNDANASTRHAQLDVQPGRLVVTDLGSTNGTLDPSGARLAAPYPLQLNQSVRIGGSSISLVQFAQSAPAAVAPGGTQVMAQVPWQAPPAAPPPGAFQPPQPPASPYGPPPGASGYGPPPGTPGPAYGPPPGMPGPGGYAPGMPGPGGYGAGPAIAGGFGAPYAPGGPAQGALVGPPQGEIATWANRVLGFLIDYLMVVGVMIVLDATATAVFFAIGIAGAGASAANADAGAAVLGSLSSSLCCVMAVGFPLAALGVGIWNRVHLVSKRGYSIGQGMMKLRVVDASGKNLTFNVALIRLLAQVGLGMVPLAGVLDLLWPLWDPQRQTLHDKAINSFVVIDRSRI